MINVSHEIPIALLEESRNFNDYDYCLVHLTLENPDYQKFYMDSLAMGRKVLLDNSLFELENMFDANVFVNKIREINAINSSNFEYVVPDALHDKIATMNSFKNFKNTFSDLPGKAIGVVQGRTLDEMIECYKYMAEHADKIAIPFDSLAFNTLYPEMDNLEAWCYGRQKFIDYLVKNNIWCNSKPHHLLGCSLAREFAYPLYREISIESIDTSNPIVAGLENLTYGQFGLENKPSVKLHTLINYQPTSAQLKLIQYNVRMFRDIVNGEASKEI